MYVGTCSILALCTEHQLACNCQACNDAAVRVFNFHCLIYLNTMYLNTGKVIQIQYLNT